MGKSTDHDQNLALKVVRIRQQYAKFQTIPSTRSPQNAMNPQIWSVSLNLLLCDLEIWRMIFSSESGQDSPAVCQISDHTFHAFSSECNESPNLISFTKTFCCVTLTFDGWYWKRTLSVYIAACHIHKGKWPEAVYIRRTFLHDYLFIQIYYKCFAFMGGLYRADSRLAPSQ